MAFDPEKIKRNDKSPVWEVGHGTRAAAAPAAGEARVDDADQELGHEDEPKMNVAKTENGDEV